MIRYIIFTIDVEFSTHPGDIGISGQVDGQEYGLLHLLDLLATHGVHATCFMDVYGYQRVGESRMAALCREVGSRGHDVQLHTHPGPLFDPLRPCMNDYTLEEQTAILVKGAELLQEFSGQWPEAHRAGDWAANQDTLLALARTGIRADSSIYFRHARSNFDHLALPVNRCFVVDGVMQIPPTIYKQQAWNMMPEHRNLDINFSTMEEFVFLMRHTDISPLVVTMHSFSLLDWNRTGIGGRGKRSFYWPNYRAQHKLVTFLRSLQRCPTMQPVSIASYLNLQGKQEGDTVGTTIPPPAIPRPVALRKVLAIMSHKAGNLLRTVHRYCQVDDQRRSVP